MSRDFQTNDRLEEQSSTEAAGKGKDDGRSSGVTIDRIASADPFWTQLAACNKDNDKDGIEKLMVDAYRQRRLGSLILHATADQMGILYHALPIIRGGDHSGAIGVALWVIFEAIPASSPGMKRLVFEARFRVNVIAHDVTNRNEQEWDSAGLRRLWVALSVLPNSDVEGNEKLVHFIRYKQGAPSAVAGGLYYDHSSVAAVNYDAPTISTTTQVDTGGVKKGDPLENVNRFDKVMRHEVGHAVDARDDLSGKYCRGATGGSWTTTHSAADWIVELMEQHGNKMLGYSPSAIATALGSLGTIPATGEALRKAITPSTKSIDPLFDVIAAAWNDWGGMSDNYTAQGSRAFHRVDGTFYSYDKAARARQVSNYQFHTPAEWFAEAYSAYYEPDSRGLGAKLHDRDPATKLWFDRTVHPK